MIFLLSTVRCDYIIPSRKTISLFNIIVFAQSAQSSSTNNYILNIQHVIIYYYNINKFLLSHNKHWFSLTRPFPTSCSKEKLTMIFEMNDSTNGSTVLMFRWIVFMINCETRHSYMACRNLSFHRYFVDYEIRKRKLCI